MGAPVIYAPRRARLLLLVLVLLPPPWAACGGGGARRRRGARRAAFAPICEMSALSGETGLPADFPTIDQIRS